MNAPRDGYDHFIMRVDMNDDWRRPCIFVRVVFVGPNHFAGFLIQCHHRTMHLNPRDMPRHLLAAVKRKHPLAEQAFELAARLMEATEARGWISESAMREHPVVEVVNAVMSASAKLAGALNGCAWPPPVEFCAHTIVRLKRARDYLDDARRAAEACAEQNLVETEWLAAVCREIEEFAGATDALLAELRAKLAREDD